MIGLYSDFGTDWAYPSIRTIASQAGLSRQTVMAAIEHLTQMGLLATNKAKGPINRIPHHPPGPQRPSRSRANLASAPRRRRQTGPISLEDDPLNWSRIL